MYFERRPGVTAWPLIWLVPDQGQRYCYCLAVKRRLCVLQERTHLYDNQGKNLLCCDILDGNVLGAQLPEHLSDRREHEPLSRAAGSSPGVPIGFERSYKYNSSPKEYNLQRELRRNYEVLFV